MIDPRPNHKHMPARTKDTIAFTNPVAVPPYTQENRAAHGSIEETEVCTCRATRQVVSNGRHVEFGPWGKRPADRSP